MSRNQCTAMGLQSKADGYLHKCCRARHVFMYVQECPHNACAGDNGRALIEWVPGVGGSGQGAVCPGRDSTALLQASTSGRLWVQFLWQPAC